MAFTHQAGFRVLNRTTPNKRYQLRFLLILRELKLLLSYCYLNYYEILFELSVADLSIKLILRELIIKS